MDSKRAMSIVVHAISDCVVCKPDEVSENSSLVSDLGADSLDMVEIVMMIEETIDALLDDASLDKDDLTVKDLVDAVMKSVENK